MTLDAYYIEGKTQDRLNISQDDARSLSSRVRDALISFHREISDTRGYIVFSFPFNELAGRGGDYIRKKCLGNGADLFRNNVVVARAVYFTNPKEAEETQTKLDRIMEELGMECLPLQSVDIQLV